MKQSSNPIFSNEKIYGAGSRTLSAEELNNIYSEGNISQEEKSQKIDYKFDKGVYKPLGAGAMSYDGLISKSLAVFALILCGAFIGWLMPNLLYIGAVVGLVFALINSFKQNPSVPCILIYALAEGVFIGGISAVFETLYSGVVMQAVIATLIVFGVTLFLFASGKVRATQKGAKIALICLISYLIYSVINIFFISSENGSQFGLSSSVEIFGIPLGVLVGILAVILGAYCLVLDFDRIKNAVNAGVDKKFEWLSAFGLAVSIIWLYIEFLRIFAIIASNRD